MQCSELLVFVRFSSSALKILVPGMPGVGRHRSSFISCHALCSSESALIRCLASMVNRRVRDMFNVLSTSKVRRVESLKQLSSNLRI